MAFFDDLTKVINDAVQKTSDMTEVSRIKSNISDEERKINLRYAEIGKLYISLHSDDYEKEFGDMITAIGESEEKIADYRKQIEKIKNVVICENCGAESQIGANFCTSCHQSIRKAGVPKAIDAHTQSADTQGKCPNCSAVLIDGAVFCTECGQSLVK